MKRRAALALPVALLAACAVPTRDAGTTPWITGRLSVRVDATETQAAQSMSAAFELRASTEGGELRLSGPLGARVATARWSRDEAVLQTSDGEQHFSGLDALSRQALGEALPLAALPDWLAARPWPGASHQPGAEGFEQLGWQVVLSRRAEGWIEARRSAPPVVRVRVKLDEPS